MKTPTKRTSYRLAAVLSLAFAATGAWAANWTVSANTVLTEDKTVDELTVEDGVTLDLNGYKLYCSSVAGSGTITSPSADADLTEPDTSEPYNVTWIANYGTAAASANGGLYNSTTPRNLFNNHIPSVNDTDRFLARASSLPIAVTYDFGEDNQKKINTYKMSAFRAGTANFKRCPSKWTFEGSNDNSSWTTLHSIMEDESWQDSGSSPKEFSFSNETAYRYYRIIFTKIGGGDWFEVNQLEYFDTNIAAGELHIDVASGTATWPSSITFSGNVKVVKEGAGTLSKSSDFNMNEGSLVIKSGAVTINGYMRIGYEAGKTAAVQIDDGTLTINGGSSNPALIIGYNGTGVLTINGGTVTVASNKDTYIGYENDSDGTLNLNGGTLTTRRIIKNNGSGVVNFNGGTLKANASVQQNGLINASAVVNVGEGGGTIDSGNLSDATSSSRVFVAAAIGGTGAIRFKGGKTINIEGAVNCTGGAIVELGTKLVAANEAAKNSILGNLAVDGITYTEDTPAIPVLQYTSDLTDPDDLVNVSFLHCGEGTAAEISGTQILVDFVAPAWELDADHLTWSSLVAKYGAPASDARVIIKSDTAYTLTIDQDVTVGELVFTGSGSVTLAVESGNTLTTDDIAGVGGITNNGTIVKTGAGTVTWPFDNAATGTTIVNVGTLKVAGKVNEGTAYNVRVKGGATFDLNGVGDVNAKVILEDGAFFTNTGSALGYNKDQIVSLTLEGDATVNVTAELGLIAPSSDATSLALGSHTLTLAGSSTFRFTNTTITGDGTIALTGSCTVVIPNFSSSGGAGCILTVGSGTTLNMGGNLSVKNFTNNGTIGALAGTLTVTGTLTPGSETGNEIRRLTLASGATIKATGTAQMVSTTFAASGTIAVDASEIDAQVLKDAGVSGIDVLTVPVAFNPSGATWNVTGAAIAGTRAKWRTDEGGTTKTLYIARPIGLMVIFR